MADFSDIFTVNGQEYRITDIFRTMAAPAYNDPDEYVVEAELNGDDMTNLSPSDTVELVFSREAAVNLMANLMELLNQRS